jgi:hypothetical protein
MTPSQTARAAALVGKARSTTGTNPYPISSPLELKSDMADLVEVTGSCDSIPRE